MFANPLRANKLCRTTIFDTNFRDESVDKHTRLYYNRKTLTRDGAVDSLFGSSAERTQCANATSVSEYNPKGYVALTIECRGMEQSVARRAHNPKVVGSSPTPATTQKTLSIRKCFFLSVAR